MDLTTFTIEQWVDIGISILVLVLTIVLGRWIIKAIFMRVIKRLTHFTASTLDDTVIEAVAPPLYWLALIYAFQFSVNRLGFIFEQFQFDFEGLYFVSYLIIGFGIALRLLNNISNWYAVRLAQTDKVELSEQLMPFLRRVIVIIMTVIVAIMLLGYFEVDVSGFVATLGIGSLAIALAAQATLSDTISGFVIMIDRPYRIGDRIEIQDLGTWGDVLDIGLRSTHIRTRDNRMVIVPNSVIAKSLIVNHSYPDSQYRIESHVGVAYGTDIEKARSAIIEAVKTVEGVLLDRPVEALFLEFGDSSLVFRIRLWLESYVDTRRMFDHVNTAVYKALNEAGIVIPFPQRVVTHKGLPSQFVANMASD